MCISKNYIEYFNGFINCDCILKKLLIILYTVCVWINVTNLFFNVIYTSKYKNYSNS